MYFLIAGILSVNLYIITKKLYNYCKHNELLSEIELCDCTDCYDKQSKELEEDCDEDFFSEGDADSEDNHNMVIDTDSNDDADISNDEDEYCISEDDCVEDQTEDVDTEDEENVKPKLNKELSSLLSIMNKFATTLNKNNCKNPCNTKCRTKCMNQETTETVATNETNETNEPNDTNETVATETNETNETVATVATDTVVDDLVLTNNLQVKTLLSKIQDNTNSKKEFVHTPKCKKK